VSFVVGEPQRQSPVTVAYPATLPSFRKSSPTAALPHKGKEPPPALSKDLLGRMIAWRIQEKFYGGHDKATIKLLDGLVRGEAEKLEAGPRLKPGTVLMREHRGVRHTVTVVLNGFVWQEQTFPRALRFDASRPSDAWSIAAAGAATS
jgi:hypothetical protein